MYKSHKMTLSQGCSKSVTETFRATLCLPRPRLLSWLVTTTNTTRTNPNQRSDTVKIHNDVMTLPNRDCWCMGNDHVKPMQLESSYQIQSYEVVTNTILYNLSTPQIVVCLGPLSDLSGQANSSGHKLYSTQNQTHEIKLERYVSQAPKPATWGAPRVWSLILAPHVTHLSPLTIDSFLSTTRSYS